MTAPVQAKATLEDVAKSAGVHRTTVSLSLRDHPRIPVETRNRIKAIAQRLGYRINPLVSALMQSRRSGKPVKHATLAYVTNYPTRYGWKPEHHDRPDFFPGAVERAHDFGYKLEHFWLGEPGMTPRRFCDMLSARSINGLIIGRLPPGQHSLDLEWNRFSCVALGMTLRSPILHHVTENHFDTVWQAMDRCRERGYRRVGFLFSDVNDSPRVGERWLGAYLAQQLRFPAEHRLPVCPDNPTSEEAFRKWFLRYQPDALLVNNPKLLLQWLKRLSVEVPRDVGLVALEHRRELECTGLYYDPAKIGGLAVEMLVGLMHRNETGVPSVQHEVLLTGEWRGKLHAASAVRRSHARLNGSSARFGGNAAEPACQSLVNNVPERSLVVTTAEGWLWSVPIEHHQRCSAPHPCPTVPVRLPSFRLSTSHTSPRLTSRLLACGLS